MRGIQGGGGHESGAGALALDTAPVPRAGASLSQALRAPRPLHPTPTSSHHPPHPPTHPPAWCSPALWACSRRGGTLDSRKAPPRRAAPRPPAACEPPLLAPPPRPPSSPPHLTPPHARTHMHHSIPLLLQLRQAPRQFSPNAIVRAAPFGRAPALLPTPCRCLPATLYDPPPTNPPPTHPPPASFAPRACLPARCPLLLLCAARHSRVLRVFGVRHPGWGERGGGG